MIVGKNGEVIRSMREQAAAELVRKAKLFAHFSDLHATQTKLLHRPVRLLISVSARQGGLSSTHAALQTQQLLDQELAKLMKEFGVAEAPSEEASPDATSSSTAQS